MSVDDEVNNKRKIEQQQNNTKKPDDTPKAKQKEPETNNNKRPWVIDPGTSKYQKLLDPKYIQQVLTDPDFGQFTAQNAIKVALAPETSEFMYKYGNSMLNNWEDVKYNLGKHFGFIGKYDEYL